MACGSVAILTRDLSADKFQLEMRLPLFTCLESRCGVAIRSTANLSIWQLRSLLGRTELKPATIKAWHQLTTTMTYNS